MRPQWRERLLVMSARTLLLLWCIPAVSVMLGTLPLAEERSAPSVIIAQQSATSQSPSATTSSKTTNYKPPRTPWGDPDLQGVYTNSNEYMTPLERPDSFAGR